MINVKNLKRHFKTGELIVKALNGVSFKIDKGEFIAIMGPSGSGKSTLLHILGLLDHQTFGEYTINNLSLAQLPEEERNYYRLTELGYVFQEYALISEMTAVENVCLSLLMEGVPKKEAVELAKKSLDKVGLKDKYYRTQDQLSGGERQRVAIARALVSNPKIIFADEPCANLDTKTSEQVLEVFKDINQKIKQTIVMVTHEPWHTKYVKRLIKLKDGKIISDRKINS